MARNMYTIHSVTFTRRTIVSVEAILSAYTHKTLTKAPAPTSILTVQSLIYTQVKTGSKQRLETDKDSSTERKT